MAKTHPRRISGRCINYSPFRAKCKYHPASTGIRTEMPANYRPAAARSGSRVGPGKLTAKYASTSLSCPPVRVPSQAFNTFPSPERTIISGVPPRPSWGATPYDEIEYTGKLKSCNFAYSVKPPSSREIPTNRYATLARRPRVLMLFALLAHQWQCGFNTYRTLGLGCEANSMLDGSPFRSETRNEVRLVPGQPLPLGLFGPSHVAGECGVASPK
jgi:hypothetical protein